MEKNKPLGPEGQCCFTCNACEIQKDGSYSQYTKEKYDKFLCHADPISVDKNPWEWCRRWEQNMSQERLMYRPDEN